MNDLKLFAGLQARVYEFLAHQDETTLHAIVSGSIQLTLQPVDDAHASLGAAPRDDGHNASHPTLVGPTVAPSRDPLQVARDLSRLASADERRIYVNAAELPVTGLRRVAKLLGLTGYGKLNRAKLTTLLVGHGLTRTDAVVTEATSPAAPPPVRSDSGPDTEPRETRPPAGSPKPNAEVAAIASRLREIETEEDGATYLREQHLDRESLLGVAGELGLTRVDRLSHTELEKRVLKQAIGARRKFAGLRKW